MSMAELLTKMINNEGKADSGLGGGKMKTCLKDFYIYDHEIFFISVCSFIFVWFWYEGDFGLKE